VVLLLLAVALAVTRRGQLVMKCRRRRRDRRCVDGDSDRHDPEQSLTAAEETSKRLLDPAATAAVLPPARCGGGALEFYLRVVSPDSAAGDDLSRGSSASSAGDSEPGKAERRQLGDASIGGAAWRTGITDYLRST